MVLCGVVVYSNGSRPSISSVSGFHQPDIGIVYPVSLVAPVDVDISAVWSVTEVTGGYGQTVGA